MRRIWTVAMFTLAIVAATTYMACNRGTSPVEPGPAPLHYVSADVCVACHITKGEQWERTLHAEALPALLASGHVADHCYACHVTGLDDNPANSGWDDPDSVVAERFGGVQCETCHGAGSRHVSDRAIMLDITLDASMCGACHEGSHHPTYEEWSVSAHADALNARDLSSHFSTECLECHSADYIFAESVPETATPFDFNYGLTCVVCHDPHSEENDYQLRADVVDLCAGCHTSEGSVPGESPHHPNGDVFQGIGGYEYPGSDYSNSAHTYLAEACVECHMWTSPFDATGQGENAIAGHEFIPLVQACQECHPGSTSFDVYGMQTSVQGLLDTLAAELDAATENDKLTISYERAKFNHDFIAQDGSLGIHNPSYVVQLLQDSIDDFEPGS